MFKRDLYIDRIRPFIDKEPVKVLTGLRRSGKSVMLELIREELRRSGVRDEQIISLNFEQLQNAPYQNALSLHAEILKRAKSLGKKVYLFFDEIQEVHEWERAVNSFRLDLDCDIYITGSNAKLLSGELATLLAGRYIEFAIYPLSYAEFLSARGLAADADSFAQYLKFGGMPGLLGFTDHPEAIREYLLDIFNSVILKDVVQRTRIRDVDLLERIITYVCNEIGHVFSATGISNYLKSENRKVAPETILNYLKACQNACLIYKAPKQSLTGKKVLSVNEKYYIADHGLREAICGDNTEHIDQIFENLVFMELLRRGYRVTVGAARDKEIDFFAEKGRQKLYVQVCYLLSAKETIEREFGVFDLIHDNYPKYVVSYDAFDMSRNGIIHKNIRDFLTGNDF